MLTAMGLRDEAAARQAANSDVAAAAERERARIDATRHHVRDDAFVELAQLCRQEGVAPLRLTPTSGAPYDGWVFHVERYNNKMLFDEQGYLWHEPHAVRIEPRGGWFFQRARTEHRPGTPVTDGEGTHRSFERWKSRPLREWAVEAAAEVLAGNTAEGVIHLNSTIAAQQIEYERINRG